MEFSSKTQVKPYILVTGFGPFGSYEKNSSWDAVQALHGKWDNDQVDILIQEIPVCYEFVLEQVPDSLECVHGRQTKAPLAIVHVGVSGIAKKITIEAEAKNCGYNRPDVNQKCPPNEECCGKGDQKLETVFDVASIVDKINGLEQETGLEAEISRCAGRYLCEFTYYKSLAASKGKALFVHVPDYNKPYSVDQMGTALRIVCETLIARNGALMGSC